MSQQWSAKAEGETLEGVKLSAAKMGADGVVNTFCQTDSDTDWMNNCWASVRCVGDAVVFAAK